MPPAKIKAQGVNYERTFIARLPDDDVNWELVPRHSEVHETTQEFAVLLAQRYNEYDALTAIAEAAKAFQNAEAIVSRLRVTSTGKSLDDAEFEYTDKCAALSCALSALAALRKDKP